MFLSISPEQFLPIVLFLLPWGMALWQIYRGLTTGQMREYLRRDYTEVDSGRAAKYCRRDREPKTFWCLFVFYLAIVALVPIGLWAALSRSDDPPPRNPQSGQAPPATDQVAP